jgi:hypothetical protein
MIATTPSGRIYSHLIIRVSRSLDPEKANFLLVRDPGVIRTEHMSAMATKR